MEIFRGSCTAIVTPFTADNKINFATFKKLINFQLANKTKAIVFMGTTGEASTLTHEEKVKICKFAVKNLKGILPVIIGSGGNNTAEVVKNSKIFESLGADALLVVTPYYNKATQKGLVEHYKKIAESVEIPIILYNVPSRTGVNLLPETVLELSKIKNIVAIKDASGNLAQTMKMMEILPKNFAIYSGDDGNVLPLLSIGAKGVISVVSNVCPAEMSCLCEEFFAGNLENSQQIQLNLLPKIEQMFKEVNPIPVKFELNKMGFNVGIPRLPLTELDKKYQ